jgi:hypothetical protein
MKQWNSGEHLIGHWRGAQAGACAGIAAFSPAISATVGLNSSRVTA